MKGAYIFSVLTVRKYKTHLHLQRYHVHRVKTCGSKLSLVCWHLLTFRSRNLNKPKPSQRVVSVTPCKGTRNFEDLESNHTTDTSTSPALHADQVYTSTHGIISFNLVSYRQTDYSTDNRLIIHPSSAHSTHVSLV